MLVSYAAPTELGFVFLTQAAINRPHLTALAISRRVSRVLNRARWRLILLHRRIDFVCPGVDAAFEIVNVRKTSLP
jgi:hypothetical protein